MIITGAKGHAKELLDILQSMKEDFYFFDNVSKEQDKTIARNYKIITTEKEVLTYLKKDSRFVLGTGNPKLRYEMAILFKNWGGELTSIISNTSIIGNADVTLGKGLNIMHHVIIYNNVHIGEGTLINTAASVHHDSTIGKYCEISPGARILGGAQVGNFCNIGAGAIILPNITIANNVTVGAGAVVTKNVKEKSIVAGVPARNTKKEGDKSKWNCL